MPAGEPLAENAFMHVNNEFKLVKYSQPGKIIHGEEQIPMPADNP
jgi:hypothetical protein